MNYLMIIKQMIADGMISQEVAAKYVPELAESEDERIRKSITEFFKNYSENGTWNAIPDVTKWIAWLEAQGKNNMGISEATKKKLEDNLNKALEKETPESWNKFLDEQGEQKPTEEYNITGIVSKNAQGKLGEMIKNLKSAWSEEDENRINRLIAYFEDKESFTAEDDIVYADWLKNLKDKVHPQTKQDWSKVDEEMLKSIIALCDEKMKSTLYQSAIDHAINVKNWLKSLRDRVQPRQEWSEEDEKMLNKAIEAACGYYVPEDKEEIRNWLRTLKNRFIPQPKPAWSEEDEKRLGLAIYMIEQAKVDAPGEFEDYRGLNQKDYQEVADWLKSLRPQNHWRPSDEQMAELRKYSDNPILRNLYYNLKK